jgi:2-C-methyl-D-erythritol 4-phosphate cytidylyltransferase
MSISAVIVAGGMGKRLGKEIPKAFVPIYQKELFLYSAQVFDKMRVFNEIIIVVPDGAITQTQEKTADFATKVVVVQGGKERHNSVENGVKKASGGVVLIHDAARPFITKELVAALIQNYENGGLPAAICANPVVDTVRKFDGSVCGQTINRSELIAVGTPQIFDKEILLNCFAQIEKLDELPTDEAMLMQKFGHKVGWINSSRMNFKVTTPEDIILAEAVAKNGEIL